MDSTQSAVAKAFGTGMGGILRPGGLLSLCSVNPHSETYAAVLREFDVATALEVVSTGEREKKRNIFGLKHPLYAAGEMAEMLKANGFEIVAHYGVRCVCDYISDNDIKSDPAFFERLVQLEMALRDRYPYYLLARFYHLIARKYSRSVQRIHEDKLSTQEDQRL